VNRSFEINLAKKGMPVASWLAALWFIGFLLAGGLLSNNLTAVRFGDLTFPYLLARIGYPALVLVALAFALRFLRACEGQQPVVRYQPAGSEATS
jgi:hypothetical protein